MTTARTTTTTLPTAAAAAIPAVTAQQTRELDRLMASEYARMGVEMGPVFAASAIVAIA